MSERPLAAGGCLTRPRHERQTRPISREARRAGRVARYLSGGYRAMLSPEARGTRREDPPEARGEGGEARGELSLIPRSGQAACSTWNLLSWPFGPVSSRCDT